MREEISRNENGGDGEVFVSKREVARRLGVSVRTMQRWMSRGAVRYHRMGQLTRFRWSEVCAGLREARFCVASVEERKESEEK